jgi:hypothetical protein
MSVLEVPCAIAHLRKWKFVEFGGFIDDEPIVPLSPIPIRSAAYYPHSQKIIALYVEEVVVSADTTYYPHSHLITYSTSKYPLVVYIICSLDSRDLLLQTPLPCRKDEESQLNAWNRVALPNSSDYATLRGRAPKRSSPQLSNPKVSRISSTSTTRLATSPLTKHRTAGWLCKVMQDKLIAPNAKSIISKHIASKDTRVIWEEIC